MTDWQHAVAVVMGAIPSSTVEKRKAFQLLFETGIAEKIGGKIADATREIAASEGWEGAWTKRSRKRKEDGHVDWS